MDANVKAVAEACSRAAEDGSLNFPQILGKLSEAGIEGYFVDYRRAVKTYYLPDGESAEVADGHPHGAVAAAFDAAKVAAAVGRSQRGGSQLWSKPISECCGSFAPSRAYSSKNPSHDGMTT